MIDGQSQEQTPWYKTGGGVAFLGALGILFLIFLVFSGFVMYYIYQIQEGNGDEIARQIQADKNFSTSESTDNNFVVNNTADPSPYIRSYNPQFGNINSPVKIITFIDFECPYCHSSFPTFETIREQYESGVHIIFKHYPLDSIHPFATPAGLAASCAEEQDSFWPYYKKLFETKTLSRDTYIEHAKAIGLDVDVFTLCIDTERYKRQLLQDIQDGLDLGIRGTPTYFVGSKKLEGVVPLDVWNTEIIHALQLQ